MNSVEASCSHVPKFNIEQGPLVGEKTPSHAISQEYAKADPTYVAKTLVSRLAPSALLVLPPGKPRANAFVFGTAIDSDNQALPQTYSHFRPIQGDGNCGWRGEFMLSSICQIMLRITVRSDNDGYGMPRCGPSYLIQHTPQFLFSAMSPWIQPHQHLTRITGHLLLLSWMLPNMSNYRWEQHLTAPPTHSSASREF